MGIPGLTNFIENTFDGWLRKLIEGNLIIDGSSLVYELYKEIDWSNGGNYPLFRQNILKVFEWFDVHEIDATVVLDGNGFKEDKNSTVLQRRKEAVKYIHSCLYHHDKKGKFEYHDKVIPVLAFEVFKMTITELAIPLLVVQGDADCVIAQLANHHKCPVLASDSDYFMFNLEGGYIPIKNLPLKDITSSALMSATLPFIVNVFYVRKFADQFRYSDVSVRLIIPAIIGNDFLDPFHGLNVYIYSSASTTASAECDHRLQYVVDYASRFTSLENFRSRIPNDREDYHLLHANCEKSKKLYSSEITQSLDELRDLEKRAPLVCSDGSKVTSKWIIQQFCDGNLSKFVADALLFGKCIPQIAVDDTESDSMYIASQPLRQYIYGLLGVDSMAEYLRDKRELVQRRVKPLHSFLKKPLPSLNEVEKLSKHEQKRLLYTMLHCDPEKLEALPEEWRLVIASVIYWATSSDTKVSDNMIKALLSCLMLCSSDLPKDRECFRTRLHLKHCPQWIVTVYTFSQWQCCFQAADNLNVLLMEPLKRVSPAKLYDGQIAVYTYFSKYDITSARESHDFKMLYLKLCGTVSEHVSKKGDKTASKTLEAASTSGATSKKKAENPIPKFKSSVKVTNRFAGLELLDPEDTF